MPALIQWWTQDLAVLSPTALEDAVYAAGADLLIRWGQPHRHYHGTRHLVEMFWALEELEDAGEIDASAGLLGRVASWWHDAVYDPRAVDGANEADSAALAREVLTSLECDAADVDLVEALVLATASHRGASDPVERAFLDADLWILSAPASRFDDYCARGAPRNTPTCLTRPTPLGRAEQHPQGVCQRVPRSTVLITLRLAWEPPARVNLDRELGRLAGPTLDVT
ncbi:MAG: hypothetical protein V9F04_15170 [Dermatophilaceae bacterium]